MSTYVHKSHNVTVLLYHLVFPAKYRRAVIDQLKFLEIGTDGTMRTFWFSRCRPTA